MSATGSEFPPGPSDISENKKKIIIIVVIFAVIIVITIVIIVIVVVVKGSNENANNTTSDATAPISSSSSNGETAPLTVRDRINALPERCSVMYVSDPNDVGKMFELSAYIPMCAPDCEIVRRLHQRVRDEKALLAPLLATDDLYINRNNLSFAFEAALLSHIAGLRC